MRILSITDQLPYPLISGDRIRVYNLLRRMAQQHEVWLASLVNSADDMQYVPPLEQFCQRVDTVQINRRSPAAHLPGLVRYALAGKPLELKFAYSEEMARKLRELVATVHFDIVEIHHSKMAIYADLWPKESRFKRVLVLHNVAFDQYGRISRIGKTALKRVRAMLNSRMMRRWEPRVAGQMDCCVTMSEADRILIERANPQVRTAVIPNGVDTQAFQPLALEGAERALLLVGKMSYAPGADGAVYFCNEVLPHIKRQVGEIDAWIVGIDPPPGVRALASDRIHVTGRVESVLPYYQRSLVCVVPLRAGGGTRLKILEAMALGRPVVSTTIGREGLDVVDGEHLLVADTPAEFAEKTVRLLSDRDLYQRITANARRLVVERYDWDAIAARQMDLYAELTRTVAEPAAA